MKHCPDPRWQVAHTNIRGFNTKDDIAQIHQDKNGRIDENRNRCESAVRNPSCGERHQGHSKQVPEISPNQARRCNPRVLKYVMVIHPDDGNKQVAHRVTNRGGPQCSKRGPRVLVRRSQFQNHHSDDHPEHRIREELQPLRVCCFLAQKTSTRSLGVVADLYATSVPLTCAPVHLPNLNVTRPSARAMSKASKSTKPYEKNKFPERDRGEGNERIVTCQRLHHGLLNGARLEVVKTMTSGPSRGDCS